MNWSISCNIPIYCPVLYVPCVHTTGKGTPRERNRQQAVLRIPRIPIGLTEALFLCTLHQYSPTACSVNVGLCFPTASPYAADEYCSGALHDLRNCCCFAIPPAVVCLIGASICCRSGSDPAIKRHRTYHKPHEVKTLQSEATLRGHLQAASNDLMNVVRQSR